MGIRERKKRGQPFHHAQEGGLDKQNEIHAHFLQAPRANQSENYRRAASWFGTASTRRRCSTCAPRPKRTAPRGKPPAFRAITVQFIAKRWWRRGGQRHSHVHPSHAAQMNAMATALPALSNLSPAVAIHLTAAVLATALGSVGTSQPGTAPTPHRHPGQPRQPDPHGARGRRAVL